MPPRLLRPKDEPGPSDIGDTSLDSKASSKRRAVSSACLPCRKRKSKCDGNQPACSTCVAVYRTECFYDTESDHRRKGALRRDIQSLQQQNDALDVIVASLRSLPEDEAINLLHSLRNESNAETLASSLRSNVRLPHSHEAQTLEADFTQASQGPPIGSGSGSFSARGAMSSESSLDEASDRAGRTINTTWFSQPHDSEFVDHLLNLYFTWIHPFYHFFSRESFLQDMSQGRTEHCSSLLLHAILAFACHYSDRPQARSEPNDPTTAGNTFFAEAKRLLDSEDLSCLTSVQALGIMGVRECSQGREGSGYKYAGRCVRMALEMGLHLSAVGSGFRSAELEARKITFWAVFDVETICCVAFGRLSQLPRAAADIKRPSTNDRVDKQIWRPYQDENLPTSPGLEQPGHSILFIEQYSRLSELASDMVNTFYAPQERFTSRRLASAYAQYQQWYRDLPNVFRLENSSLPYVVVLHMYYYACVLHLFRPYIKLDLRAASLFPHDTCTFCANEISALMNGLRAMYGLRRIHLAVTSLVLSACTIHLLNLPSESAAVNLSQGMHDLQAMSVNHTFASRCVEIVRSLAVKWNVALPEHVAQLAAMDNASYQSTAPGPNTTFFAISIPRADSGTHSSSTGSQESPFSPPPRPRPQVTSYASFVPEDGVLDPTQSQNAFWTPFPSQGTPNPASSVNQLIFDFSQQPNWAMTDAQGRHRSAPGGMDEPGRVAQGGFNDWNWQS